MTDRRGAGFLSKAFDTFIVRLISYAILVFSVGLFAFMAELFLERFNFALLKHAVADGMVTGSSLVAGLVLFELVLYRGSLRTRRLEAEARKSDRMLISVAQAIPDLVYIKDAEGRHLMVNKAVEAFTGQAADQLHGKTMADLMPPDLAASCMRSDREPVDTGMPVRAEERFMSAGGVRILDTIKTPLRDERGIVVGIVGVSRDITDKVRAEEERRLLQTQLLQAQKMEALGHLAGGVAHDFSNILTAIMGYAGILKSGLAHDDQLAGQAGKILEASERAKTIIKGLFAFSSKQKIDAKPIDLNAVVNGGWSLLLHLVNERIAVRMKCCDEPLTVVADQSQLERVLMNLAANAQDAMPDGGELVFSTGPVEMGDDFIQMHGYGIPGRYALLAVSDTGRGISDEDRKKVFDPFFTTKQPGKGTGLGLAIVYGIVKQHRGYINVVSGAGRGTTFHVYLPLAGMS